MPAKRNSDLARRGCKNGRIFGRIMEGFLRDNSLICLRSEGLDGLSEHPVPAYMRACARVRVCARAREAFIHSNPSNPSISYSDLKKANQIQILSWRAFERHPVQNPSITLPHPSKARR
jgi:hypothetical protein